MYTYILYIFYNYTTVYKYTKVYVLQCNAYLYMYYIMSTLNITIIHLVYYITCQRLTVTITHIDTFVSVPKLHNYFFFKRNHNAKLYYY